MASIPAYREAAGSRSGGKIVRARQARSRTAPYERPGRSNLGPGGNPSWISRFIFSPTLTIASGAGKIISSVFVSDSDDSSSDSDSEDDVEDDVHDENRVIQETGVKKFETSETVNLRRKDFPPEKKDSKRLIEQLLMQETFSRAERDKLFQIIESRVVECQTIEGEAAGRLTRISNRAVDSDDGRPAVCSSAILEAKKWLNEKRLGLGSSSTLELENGACTLDSTMLPVVNDEERGSPVDVAKSYMRERPPWASPSTNNFEFKSPSSLGLQLFKEETPYSISGNRLSSSKLRRESPASGPWNIQEEIRRVRSRATEEMLRTRPSAKLDWSSLASDYKSNLSSARSVKSIDKSMNWSADNRVTHNLSESNIAQDVSENGTCLLNTNSNLLQQDEDLETNPTTTERKVSNSSLDERECSTVHEAAGLANGFPPVTGSSGELAVEQNHVDNIVEENNSSGHDSDATGLPVEERCELLSEVYMEVPNVNENDTDKVVSDGNDTGKISLEENGAGNVNAVEKPNSQSRVGPGKTVGAAYLRRGRRKT